MIPGIEPVTTTALIFGGCCTNVFALEAIVKVEPSSGMFTSSTISQVCSHSTGLIITFLQFVFVTFFAYPSQFEPGAKYTLQAPKVPMRRWAFIAFMFYGINMLNNWAFAYNISVPVHIILRSFGSVTTMIAGFLRGKRYSLLQVLSVVLLTVGVLISAWADSESKVRPSIEIRVYLSHANDIPRERRCPTNLVLRRLSTHRAWPYSFLRNSFPHTWVHIPKTLTHDSERAGPKISSTRTF